MKVRDEHVFCWSYLAHVFVGTNGEHQKWRDQYRFSFRGGVHWAVLKASAADFVNYSSVNLWYFCI